MAARPLASVALTAPGFAPCKRDGSDLSITQLQHSPFLYSDEWGLVVFYS